MTAPTSKSTTAGVLEDDRSAVRQQHQVDDGDDLVACKKGPGPHRNLSEATFWDQREVLAHEYSRARWQFLRVDLPADHPVTQGIALPVWREMDMEVGNAPAEHIRKDKIGGCSFLQGLGGPRHGTSEGLRFLAVKVCNVGNVSTRFEIREARDLPVDGHRETPERVRPHFHARELRIALGTPTDHATSGPANHANPSGSECRPLQKG